MLSVMRLPKAKVSSALQDDVETLKFRGNNKTLINKRRSGNTKLYESASTVRDAVSRVNSYRLLVVYLANARYNMNATRRTKGLHKMS